MRNSQKGFTLIELLVVIAIIGLLSTLAVVALNSAREKSRDSKRVADVKQIQTALELYFADSSSGYPATPAVSGTCAAGVLGCGNAAKLCDQGFDDSGTACTNTTYMGLVPSAPTPVDGGCLPADNAYTYTQTGTGSGYTVTFCLGGQVGDLAAGDVTASQDGMTN
jgi:prepilin-type N-terminal cleavage/methylation domain-containing protein